MKPQKPGTLETLDAKITMAMPSLESLGTYDGAPKISYECARVCVCVISGALMPDQTKLLSALKASLASQLRFFLPTNGDP